MRVEDILQQQFLEVVENQLRADDPKVTRLTLERLVEEGYDRENAKKLISACVAAALFEVMKNNQPFDEVKYTDNLNRLPELPE